MRVSPSQPTKSNPQKITLPFLPMIYGLPLLAINRIPIR